MGRTYQRSEIAVLTDPATGQVLRIDPSEVAGSLVLQVTGFSAKVVLPLADSAVLQELQQHLQEAHADDDLSIVDRRGWQGREFAEDDDFNTEYIEGEADGQGGVFEGTVAIGGKTPSGLPVTLPPISIGLAIGLSDELDSYVVIP